MLIKCPECGRKISDTARICPSCRGNLSVLKNREADMRKVILIIAFAVLGVAVAILAIIFTFLAPGLFLNWIVGRFKDDPDGFILASEQDWITWVVSLSVWMFFVLLGFKLKKRVSKNKEDNSLNKLPTVPAIKFHIEVDNQDAGEMNLEAITKLVAEGKVRRSTLVWRDGMAGWQVAEAQTELRWLFQGQPPPLQS